MLDDDVDSSSPEFGPTRKRLQSLKHLLINLIIRGVLLNAAEPWMLYSLLSGDPLSWIFLKHLAQQINKFFTEMLGVLNLAGLDGVHELVHCVAFEWHDSGEKLVYHDSEGPNIALLVVEAGENLWSQVVRRASHTLLLLLHLASESEVNELGCAALFFLVEHDVLGLDVSVDNVQGVDVHQSTQEVFHDASSHFLAILLLLFGSHFGESLVQLAAEAELHAEVDVGGVLVGLEVVDYVWVVALLNELNLLMNAIDFLLAQLAFANLLDGNELVGILPISSLIHDTKRALS